MSAQAPFPQLPRGVFTVSVDLELAWGLCDLPLSAERYAAIGREREVVDRLLELCERYSVRATWAVVAHLLLDRWDVDERGRPHPRFPRPVRRGERRDHFHQLPPARHPAWWGGDLVAAIRSARPAHEIGSHSFCHLLFDERRTRPAAAAADIDTAREIHRREGLAFDSFVYPRNVVGFKPLLRSAGVRVFRDVTPRWHQSLRPRPLLRAARLIAYLGGRTPPTVRPRFDHGMVAVGDSLLLLGRDGARSLVSAKALRRQACRGLERAAARREVFHLWFHPANLVTRSDEQLATLAEIFGRCRELVAAGRLENWVMGDFATFAESAARPAVTSEPAEPAELAAPSAPAVPALRSERTRVPA